MRASWLLCLSVCLGCGGSPAGEAGVDGFDDGTKTDSPSADDPALAPELPSLLPCREGWYETTEEGHSVCSPFPAGTPSECPTGSAHFPGDPGCSTIADPCPDGLWPDGLPSDETVHYVNTLAAEAGNGSLETPFDNLDAAIASASAGDVIAFRGHHVTEILIDVPVTVIGSCPASIRGHTKVSASGVELRNLAFTKMSDEPALEITATGSLVATGLAFNDGISVRIDGGTKPLAVNHGTAHFEHVVFAESSPGKKCAGNPSLVARPEPVPDPQPEDDPSCFPVSDLAAIDNGGDLIVRKAVITGVAFGISTSPEATTELFDVAFYDLSNYEEGGLQIQQCLIDGGVALLIAGELESEGAWISAARGQAIRVSATADATLRDTVIRGTYETSFALEEGYCNNEVNWTNGKALGFAIDSNGTVLLERLLLGANRGSAIRSRIGSLKIEDAIILATASHSSPFWGIGGDYGRGLSIEGGALSASRISVAGNRDAGVYLYGSETTGVATDLTIVDTSDQACAVIESCQWDSTASIAVVEGAALSVERFDLRNSELIGVLVGAGGDVQLKDGIVADNDIAANVHDADFPLHQLQNNVLWLNNGVSLDSEELPVPQPELDLESL